MLDSSAVGYEATTYVNRGNETAADVSNWKKSREEENVIKTRKSESETNRDFTNARFCYILKKNFGKKKRKNFQFLMTYFTFFLILPSEISFFSDKFNWFSIQTF